MVQDMDETIKNLAMLSEENYIKAVGVINGLLGMQEDEELDEMADELVDRCSEALKIFA